MLVKFYLRSLNWHDVVVLFQSWSFCVLQKHPKFDFFLQKNKYATSVQRLSQILEIPYTSCSVSVASFFALNGVTTLPFIGVHSEKRLKLWYLG